MASEGFPVQSTALASGASAMSGVTDHLQTVPGVLNTTQTDSEAISFEKSRAAAGGERPEAPKPTEETKPPVPPATEQPLGGAVAASEPQPPATTHKEESNDVIAEPQTGEKRTFESPVISDSAPAPAAPAPASIPEPISAVAPRPEPVPAPVPAPAPKSEEREKPLPERSDEPEAKKQKIAQETSNDVKGPTVSSASTDNADQIQKKPARPKKEKVKDAVKKAIPTDGIGSRTRSRTKAT
ncbi:hypothetical protein N7532_004149 [Penicillium argentinense]|uniref:Uncharacterized protein n=1 Tax=Penicillium argentinense TaxID=1131581 RepID=A0A9W9KEI9_9EURO|nr:uncharacterized protein N7532_004149 [Penicillium argentinense]KAJ5103620.1 hypothetical protein N7532_004149 [Penicillium argentinense]